MNTTRKTLLAALLAAVAATPAFADKGRGRGGDDHRRDRVEHVERHHDRHGGDHHDHHDRHGRGRGSDDRHFDDRRHSRLDRSCPPGLAKKHNGCLPPGQAKKLDRVIVGEALPRGAVFTVPRHVRSTLPPPPPGHRYAVIDNQVVLVSNSNIVVDIILRSLLG